MGSSARNIHRGGVDAEEWTKIGSSGRLNMAAVAKQHNHVARGDPSHSFAGEHEGPTMKNLLLPAHGDAQLHGPQKPRLRRGIKAFVETIEDEA